MNVVKTIITATALVVVCSGAALAEDYRYDKPIKFCNYDGTQCVGTEGKDFIMGTFNADYILGKGGRDDIDAQGAGPQSYSGYPDRVAAGLGNDRV
jgi:RTX calcium-binding nonapeptide repeat (4 copies)